MKGEILQGLNVELKKVEARRGHPPIRHGFNIYQAVYSESSKATQEPRNFPEFLSSILISPYSYAFGEAVMASVMMVLPSSTFFSSIGLAAGTCGKEEGDAKRTLAWRDGKDDAMGKADCVDPAMLSEGRAREASDWDREDAEDLLPFAVVWTGR